MSHVLSYGNGLPSDFLGVCMPKDTFVRPVEEPLYIPVGGIGGEINQSTIFVSTLAVSSITGEFLNNNVDMRTVNLAVSTLIGGSNGTLSTIGSVLFENASTGLISYRGTVINSVGKEQQGQIFFGTSTLNVQLSNTLYQQNISWTPSVNDGLINNNAVCIVNYLSDNANVVSTPITAVQKTTKPYNNFQIVGQSNATFSYLIVHSDQPVL